MRTLSDGRQRRSREEWQRIVSRFERSGLSENLFCEEQRLTRKTFRTWRQRLAEEGGAPPPFVEIAMPKPAFGTSALLPGSLRVAASQTH